MWRGVAIIIFGVVAASAGAAPVPVTTDIFDVSRGTVVTSQSSGSGNFAEFFGAVGNGDVYFQDGRPAGFAHFVEIRTAAPVTTRSLALFGHDDRSTGDFGRRALSGFRLYGWDGSVFQNVLTEDITVPYPSQGPDGAVLVYKNIH